MNMENNEITVFNSIKIEIKSIKDNTVKLDFTLTKEDGENLYNEKSIVLKEDETLNIMLNNGDIKE